MRLQQYITESTTMEIESVYELNKLIHKDCKPYLSLIGNRKPLYRGMVEDVKIGVKSVRQDRRPLGMTDLVAKQFNKWLKKNGHVPRDKAVFATSDKDAVDMFGKVFYFFPIGKFNYTFIRSEDANIEDPETGWHHDLLDIMFPTPTGSNFYDISDFIKYNYKLSDDCYSLGDNIIRPASLKGKMSCIENAFKKYFVTNKNFNEAYKKRYEIWFDCKKYYFVNEDYFLWMNGKLNKVYSGV
jgi:hypothetical protein